MKAAQRQIFWTSRLLVACIAFFAIAPAAWAQDSSPSQSSSSSSSSSSNSERREIRRIWVGLAASYTPFRLVTTGSETNSTTGETVSSTPGNGQLGGGVNVNLRVYGSFWLNIGGVYRFGGYDSNDAIYDANNTVYIDRMRVRLFDFPLLVRYAGPKFHWNKHSFYEAGGAFRYVNSIDEKTGASNFLGYFCCAPASTASIRKTTEGVVVGTGVVGQDDFGIKVAPEVRYTRWMGDTFNAPTVGTQRNQLEVVLSFGF